MTIWRSYGSYHLARVEALGKTFPDAEIICYSHCREDAEYEFFNRQPRNHRVLVDARSSDLNFIQSFLATLRALLSDKPTLILTVGYERPETLASVLYSAFTKSSVFLMLNNQRADHDRLQIVESVKRGYLRIFQGFVHAGNTSGEYLLHLGAEPQKMVGGYNCVDNGMIWDLSERSRRQYPAPFNGRKYFLTVARMIPKKNYEGIIRAYHTYMQEVASTETPWLLVIIGDGTERGRIEAMIVDMGLQDSILLLGQINEMSKIVYYYTFASSLVHASHENEQWGLVVNEAMASGLPVLVSNQTGCSSDLVENGVNGFTFDGNSSEGLAKHMLWMHHHKDRLQRMGHHSREIIKQYSPEVLAQNIHDLVSRTRFDLG